MTNKVIIATAHSVHFHPSKDKKIELTLEGGSPWFGYIWIDDKLYTVTRSTKQVSIKRTK